MEWSCKIVRENRSVLALAVIIGLVLVLWRALRLPFFAWIVAACCLIAVVATTFKAFPQPTRAPRQNLRTASGTIKTLETWKYLFAGSHDRDAIRWIADQPVTVTGVEFVPEGKTEPVVAVDLIDEGSIPGLAEHSAVNIDYESASPRVAYIRGATRRFAGRNLRGLVLQGFSMLIVTVVLLSFGKGIGLLYRRLPR